MISVNTVTALSDDNGDDWMILRPRYVAFVHPFSLDADADLRLADKQLPHHRHVGARIVAGHLLPGSQTPSSHAQYIPLPHSQCRTHSSAPLRPVDSQPNRVHPRAPAPAYAPTHPLTSARAPVSSFTVSLAPRPHQYYATLSITRTSGMRARQPPHARPPAHSL